jgi:hypothetical protein
VLRFKYESLCWVIMAKDTARGFVPVICCRKAGPALAGGEVFGWSIGSNKSFLRRPGWGEFRRVVADLREHCPAAKPVVVRTAWLAPEMSRRMHPTPAQVRHPAEQQDGPSPGDRDNPPRMGPRSGLELLTGQTRLGAWRQPGVPLTGPATTKPGGVPIRGSGGCIRGYEPTHEYSGFTCGEVSSLP